MNIKTYKIKQYNSTYKHILVVDGVPVCATQGGKQMSKCIQYLSGYNVNISDGRIKKILDKYGVDYAVTKDLSKEKSRFLVFFKARDVDVLKAAFKEYSAAVLQKEKRPSVLERLKHFKELEASLPRKVREKTQERGL